MLSLSDEIDLVLQLDDKKGTVFGYKGVWGTPYLALALGSQ